jgi:hypothetical protein
MDVMNFIKPELLILVPVLYVIGMGIKKSKISDNYIPLILGVVSVFLSTLWVIATSDIKSWQDAMQAIFISVTQGVLTAGASVYVNQLYIQSKKDE